MKLLGQGGQIMPEIGIGRWRRRNGLWEGHLTAILGHLMMCGFTKRRTLAACR